MNALKLSAQFAAYVWYTETNRGPGAPAEAVRFARDSWTAFLPSATRGGANFLCGLRRAARPKNAPAAGTTQDRRITRR